MAKLTVETCRTLLRRELGLRGQRAVFMSDDKQTAEAYAGERVRVVFRVTKGVKRQGISMSLYPHNVPDSQMHRAEDPNVLILLFDLNTLEPLK